MEGLIPVPLFGPVKIKATNSYPFLIILELERKYVKDLASRFIKQSRIFIYA
jgi:hypothetical protein